MRKPALVHRYLGALNMTPRGSAASAVSIVLVHSSALARKAALTHSYYHSRTGVKNCVSRAAMRRRGTFRNFVHDRDIRIVVSQNERLAVFGCRHCDSLLGRKRSMVS
jgi:hypothetical protein